MKTNDLIAMLQQTDPENECEVCVGNCPVWLLDKLPWYYDGKRQSVERKDGWPIRGGYPGWGMKLNIRYDDLEGALLDNPDMELDLSGITYDGKVNPRHQQQLDRWIAEGRKFQIWDQLAKQARKEGRELPPFPPLSFKERLSAWLRKIGWIE